MTNSKSLKQNIPTEIEGVLVKVSPRAKRLSMSFDVRVNDIVLTMPKRASRKSVEEFINEHRDWITENRNKLKVDDLFIEGGKLSIYGHSYMLTRKDGRGQPYIEEDKLVVFGNENNFSRKVKDFLKALAHEKIKEHLLEKVWSLGKHKCPEFRIADPKSRWGSCTSDGRIMFSWRLILTPVDVLDYVVAHEASHLVHMDHSPKFWELCYSMTKDACSAKIWIKRNGTRVMGYR